jgi:uncharacterized protein
MREVRFAALETFEQHDDGMTFGGVAIPYGDTITIEGLMESYDEVFHRGAFHKTLKERNGKPVPLLQSHDYRSWGIGYAEQLEETDRGLEGVWRLSDVQAGREASVLIHDRVVSGLSIGFEPITNRVTKGKERGQGARDLVERKEVKLHEISLCQFPAYELAQVTGQRSKGKPLAELAQTRAQLVDRFGRVRRWP